MNNQPLYISIILYLNLFQTDGRRKFIIDTGVAGANKDRLSIYTENDYLVFSLIDRTGIEYSTKTTFLDLKNEFHSLLFEIENFSDRSIISIFKDNQLIASTDTAFPLIFTNNPFEQNYFIGADVFGNNQNEFEVAEQLVYGKVLSQEEKKQIQNYLANKHQGNPKSKMRFINGAYLYRDYDHAGLIQPVTANQPKYLNSENNEQERV